jgi:hypothetical protein
VFGKGDVSGVSSTAGVGVLAPLLLQGQGGVFVVVCGVAAGAVANGFDWLLGSSLNVSGALLVALAGDV